MTFSFTRQPVFTLIQGTQRVQLTRQFVCWWNHRRIVFERGFETDLASVPWYLLWIAPDWRTLAVSALVHDYLYRWGGWVQEGVYSPKPRRWCDFLFYLILRQSGVGWVTAQSMHAIVRLRGRQHWDRHANARAIPGAAQR